MADQLESLHLGLVLVTESEFEVKSDVTGQELGQKAGEPTSGHVTSLLTTDSESPSNFEKL